MSRNNTGETELTFPLFMVEVLDSGGVMTVGGCFALWRDKRECQRYCQQVSPSLKNLRLSNIVDHHHLLLCLTEAEKAGVSVVTFDPVYGTTKRRGATIRSMVAVLRAAVCGAG